MNEDTNSIIYAYLNAQTVLTDVATGGIFCPRLPENTVLPALSFNTRGGLPPNPHIKPIVTPSVQFDCYGSTPIEAREVYRALYDVLEGIQMVDVVVDGSTYKILSAMEEGQGQDRQDEEILTYFKVLTFFTIMVRAEAT